MLAFMLHALVRMSPAPRCTQRSFEMIARSDPPPGLPESPQDPPEPAMRRRLVTQRRRLAGSFVSQPEKLEDGFDYDDTSYQIDNHHFFADEMGGGDRKQYWSHRSTEKRSLWADPEQREAMLAKRRATIAAKKALLGIPPPPPKPPLAPAVAKRAEALRLRFSDETAWMDNRLAAGAEKRAMLNNDEVKAEQQRQRKEVARQRAAELKRKKIVEQEARRRDVTDASS